ncbi:MAG TPA: response regulator [Pyrinomonadaceae bacterium]|nr:response regulator [Pyrinomonadaceae bacterium]
MQENHTLVRHARISIVDDDASMREAINTLISSIGFNVNEFLSAEDFLKSDRFEDFDCLILDVRMPGLDGLELQRRLIAANNNIPIVFITAHYSEEQRRIAMDAGAVAFLRKPFTEEELLNAIDASLAIRNKSVDRLDEERD